MAGGGAGAEAKSGGGGPEKEHFSALLGTAQRDFLVDNKGNQVPIKSLQGKIVGLYFSGQVRDRYPAVRCATVRDGIVTVYRTVLVRSTRATATNRTPKISKEFPYLVVARFALRACGRACARASQRQGV